MCTHLLFLRFNSELQNTATFLRSRPLNTHVHMHEFARMFYMPVCSACSHTPPTESAIHLVRAWRRNLQEPDPLRIVLCVGCDATKSLTRSMCTVSQSVGGEVRVSGRGWRRGFLRSRKRSDTNVWCPCACIPCDTITTLPSLPNNMENIFTCIKHCQPTLGAHSE